MESFVYYAPTEVIFGRGAEEKNRKGSEKMGRNQSPSCLWRRKC